ncbi:MFS transporter [Synoicihabitans lomoniglobus]|uniref:MFS transporter n=1 Tax=Synoicihabitans lomoniglobus TaxID=2909285 RepID=A0AAF0CS00_9BACT|nr:MFS transporter [Opitutaceae bacterium LMO-M01]WED66906.1 MFS transporter [Opitutaceae bacterium LMO-M01]
MIDTKLPLREKLAYGCGDFASVLFWQTFMRYLPFFYTDVFGLTAAMLANLLLFSRVLDGVSDPVIGMWADRTESKWGKFRPFILFGCMPFAIFGVLTFTTPDLGDNGKIIWAFVTYNGLMLLYTLVNIPYTAMLGVMTTNSVERTRLSSIKFIFAFAAGTVISATLLPMVSALGGAEGNPQQGWQTAFIIVGIVAVAFFLITVFGTKERIKPTPDPEATVGKDIKMLLGNNAWVLLLATTLTFILFVAVRSSVSTHYYKYYVFDGNTDVANKLSLFGNMLNFDNMVSAFNTGGQLVSMAGVLVTAMIAKNFRKGPLYITFFVLAIIATASFYVVPADQIETLFILDLLGSAASAPLPVLLWAMYADTADYGEWKNGRRTTALVFSASTMGQKVGWAVAGYIAFMMLSGVGFEANTIPSDDVKHSLVLLMSLAPAALGILSIVIFKFYPLTDQKMAGIEADLDARRAAAGTPTE